MQKKLIALAIAGAFAAPAFAATSNVDVYGVMHIAIEDTDVSGSDIAVVDRVSRIGFKGSEDLGGGLSAIWQIEQQISSTGADGVGGTQSFANRNTFIGLSSKDFGTFLVGRHDTPYKLGTGSLDPFADTAGDYNLGGVKLAGAAFTKDAQFPVFPDGTDDENHAYNTVFVGDQYKTGSAAAMGFVNSKHDMRSPSAIAYVSPTWSGFHFALAGVATNSASNANSDDTIDAVSATAVYSNGPLFGSLSYQQADNAKAALGIDQIVLIGTTSSYADDNDVLFVEPDDTAFWKLGLGYTFGNLKLGAIYERGNVDIDYSTKWRGVVNHLGSGDIEVTNWMLNATYTMGNVALKAAYGDSELDVDGLDLEADSWTLGVDYNLSKRTTVYALYNRNDADSLTSGGVREANDNAPGADDYKVLSMQSVGNTDVSTWAIGLKHSF